MNFIKQVQDDQTKTVTEDFSNGSQPSLTPQYLKFQLNLTYKTPSEKIQ